MCFFDGGHAVECYRRTERVVHRRTERDQERHVTRLGSLVDAQFEGLGRVEGHRRRIFPKNSLGQSGAHTGTRRNYSHQSFFHLLLLPRLARAEPATPFNLTQRPRRPQSFPSLRTTQMLPSSSCLRACEAQGGASVCLPADERRSSLPSRCSAREPETILPALAIVRC